MRMMRSRSPPRPARAWKRCSRRSCTACPRPKATPTRRSRRCLVDSWYDAYLGVVVLVRIFDGMLQKGQRIRLMLTGGVLSGRSRRHLPPQAGDARARWGPARSASSPPRSGRWPTPASATPSPTRRSRPQRRCPASSRRSRWCSAACSRSMRPSSRICARRSASSASTMRASPMRWRPRPRSASASAAAFSGCCISRSSASGWSASSISI